MSDLTAIDILIEPDQTMVSRAKAVNARMIGERSERVRARRHHRRTSP